MPIQSTFHNLGNASGRNSGRQTCGVSGAEVDSGVGAGVGPGSVGPGSVGAGSFGAHPREVQVIWVSDASSGLVSAGILLDGVPATIELPSSVEGEIAADFTSAIRKLHLLPHDSNFYGSLPDLSTRIEYLSGHSHGGQLFGRILFHEIPGQSDVLSIAVPGGFSMIPVTLSAARGQLAA